MANKKILVADDSSVARKQIQRAITALGLECDLVKDGREALELLKETAKTQPIIERYALMISDVEMPEMDGYTLTAEVRANPDLAALHIILHTSLSGIFNQAMVEKVGANDFIAKFDPDELATAVQKVINGDVSTN
jgi:two-component system chemotaxis response regulator CheV